MHFSFFFSLIDQPLHRRLRKGSMPSVFEWSKPDSDAQQHRAQRAVRRELQSKYSSLSSHQEDCDVHRPHLVCDFDPVDIGSERDVVSYKQRKSTQTPIPLPIPFSNPEVRNTYCQSYE